MSNSTIWSVSDTMAQVGGELGLWAESDLDTGYLTGAAQDENQNQMFRLLRGLGQHLIRLHPWLAQTKQHTFTAFALSTFNLPADFFGYVDGTGWNRTTQQPMVAVSPQRWQALKAANTTGVLYVIFRPRERTLEMLETATLGDSYAFEYASTYWASAAGGTEPTAASLPVGDETDLIWLETNLFQKALKLQWLKHKGLPAEAAQEDFDDALSAAQAADASPAPKLVLDSPRVVDAALCGPCIPETGWGT